MRVVCPDDGSSRDMLREHFIDFGILFPVIAPSIFSSVPEAERKNTIRLCLRVEDQPIQKSGLLLQDGQDLVVDCVCDLMCLAGLGGDFDHAGEHMCSFRWLDGERNRRGRDDGSMYSVLSPTVCLEELLVNCPNMVQRPRLRRQALFLEVMAEKADQRCSTFLLPQCGHRTSPSSYSTRDRILSKNFLHFWQ